MLNNALTIYKYMYLYTVKLCHVLLERVNRASTLEHLKMHKNAIKLLIKSVITILFFVQPF